jgi:hypothetical protein
VKDVQFTYRMWMPWLLVARGVAFGAGLVLPVSAADV